MARKKTALMKWMDRALRADPDLAKEVDERLKEMRRERDELERSRKTSSKALAGRGTRR